MIQYEDGYTKALLDVYGFFESHSDGLKSYKMYNQKQIHNLLKAILDNRKEFMKYGADTCIKVVCETKPNGKQIKKISVKNRD